MIGYEMLTSNYGGWCSEKKVEINLAFESNRLLRLVLAPKQQASRGKLLQHN
jgi:hypothetical protein